METLAILNRKESNDFQTLGELHILYDGLQIFKCHVLELPYLDNQQRVSCIPKGEYSVIPRYSEKYGNSYHILNVPNRSFILIHSGNYYRDTLGCLIVGKGLYDIDRDGNKDVTSSRDTMYELNKILKEPFKLQINGVVG